MIVALHEDGWKCEEGTEINLFGKLFCKKIIEDKKMKFEKDEIYPSIRFLLRYLSDYSEIQIDESVSLYSEKTNFTVGENSNELGIEKVKEFLDVCKDSGFCVEIFKFAFYEILENSEQEDRILIGNLIAERFLDAYEINYLIAEKYIKPLVKECLVEEKEQYYREIKRYFSLLINEKILLKGILKLWDIDETQMEVWLNYSLKEYKFYAERVNEEVCAEIDAVELKEKLERLESEITSIKENINEKSIINTNTEVILNNTNYQEGLCGPELAEYIISTYQMGGLGLKTLVKAFAGWLKYKVRGAA